MKKLLLIMGMMMLVASVVMALITGSGHDFSDAGGFNGNAWATNVDGVAQICLPCHTPHSSQTNSPPIWNHDASAGPFTMYSGNLGSGVISGSVPNPESMVCLGCHDGVVALDAFGKGGTGSGPITGTLALDTDLSDDHPVSITYTGDGGPLTELHIAASTPFGVGGNIEDALFNGGTTVECATCHDVHNTDSEGIEKLLRVTVTGSQLCLACHMK